MVDRIGQEVVAFACLRPQTSATAGELTRYAKQRLSAAKYPRDVRIAPELPLTDVLTPDRRRLRERERVAQGRTCTVTAPDGSRSGSSLRTGLIAQRVAGTEGGRDAPDPARVADSETFRIESR